MTIPLGAQEDFLQWDGKHAKSVALAGRVTGQAGKSLDFRITATDRSYNFSFGGQGVGWSGDMMQLFNNMKTYLLTLKLAATVLCLTSPVIAQKYDYRLLATSKTSTMEKEMNAAGDAGFVFGSVMGGDSAMGGKEVLVVMTKNLDSQAGNKKYLLLAASKTSTLQKELQQAGDDGYSYCGQTVFESAFGGREVSIILERGQSSSAAKRIEYKLLATSKTSTMEKELRQAGDAGFMFLGVVVGKTAMGGKEVISILHKVEK